MAREQILTAADVVFATGGRLVAGDRSKVVGGFSIDSRTVAVDELFVAIRGERFDGHDFVRAAFERGAQGAIVSEERTVAAAASGAVLIVVSDTVVALQSLARHIRRESGAKVTAITGSAGKTTTKELAAAFLETRYSVLRNRGNLNNHIGLPLSLLELRHGPEMAVVELGMNHAGEISTLVRIAEPEVRVWTNVGQAHLEFFGSMDAIADAKAEILEAARPEHVVVANADDPLVMARIRRFGGRVVTFGRLQSADVRVSDFQDHGLDGFEAVMHTPAGATPFRSPLIGEGSLSNMLAAAAVALHFGVPPAEIASVASNLRPMPHRGEVRRLAGGVIVIDDSYNSNPAALERALRVLTTERAAKRRIAVIGEMLELGAASSEWHERCGRVAAAAGVDHIVTVGGEPARMLGAAAEAAGMPASAVSHVSTSMEAAERAASLVKPGDVVLVKGSRGIRTELVVERLTAEFS